MHRAPQRGDNPSIRPMCPAIGGRVTPRIGTRHEPLSYCSVLCTSSGFRPEKKQKNETKQRRKEEEEKLFFPCHVLPPYSRCDLSFTLLPGQKERIVSPNPKPIVYVRGVPRLGFIELKSSGALKRGVRIVNVMHKQQRLGTKYLEASNTCLF